MNTLLTEEESFRGLNLLKVDDSSKVPKYMQIVDIVMSDIENGIFGIGEQIPSINETSAEFDMARDTVEKAYKILKEKGVLSAVKGKGYYVASTGKMCSKRGLMLLSEMTDEKMSFYKSFVSYMPDDSVVDILLFNGNPNQLERNIISNLGHYDYFVVSPQLNEVTDGLRKAIRMVPKNKLIFIDQRFDDCLDCSSIVNNEREEMYRMLQTVDTPPGKYTSFHLIFPNLPFHQDLHEGFTDYCFDNKLPFTTPSSASEVEVAKGQMYLVRTDTDLVELIKRCTASDLELGEDVGLICYSDSPLKEVLAGGISVFAPDFDGMAQQAAQTILRQDVKQSKKGFMLKKRNSI
ncbi:MAG: GntR family transcriptional regulator [Bacteroidota bacterium]